MENFLAMPVLRGRKTDKEKFKGAEETYTVECMMQSILERMPAVFSRSRRAAAASSTPLRSRSSISRKHSSSDPALSAVLSEGGRTDRAGDYRRIEIQRKGSGQLL